MVSSLMIFNISKIKTFLILKHSEKIGSSAIELDLDISGSPIFLFLSPLGHPCLDLLYERRKPRSFV